MENDVVERDKGQWSPFFHYFEWIGGFGQKDGNYDGQCTCEEIVG